MTISANAWPDEIVAVLFDVGDTLVHAAPPATAVAELQVVLRPDVVADLQGLKSQGLRLGAVTDTAVMVEAQVRELLSPSGVDELLEVVVTSVDVGAAKPDPASLTAAIDRLGVRPEQVLYIGDRVIDRQAADAVGCEFAFVADTVADTISRWLKVGSGPFDEARQSWVQGAVDRDERRRQARVVAQERLDSLAKPPGSLGRLEELAMRLAEIAGECPPRRPHPVHVAVFAADHGVHAEGVSAWPQAITAAMVGTIADGRAAISALARSVDAEVTVIDVGVATAIERRDEVVSERIKPGTNNLATGAAMTLAEVSHALDVGVEVAERLIGAGARMLVIGEMGIANTTSATALIAAYAGNAVSDLVGRGAGADDAALVRKTEAITAALGRLAAEPDPLEVLAGVGGLEIAAMAGLVVAAAARRVPVVVDGAIANAALLAAERLAPGVAHMVIAGHRSTEPAATVALRHLGLDPILDLDMRLGEGTGAVLAVPIIDAASRLFIEVATIAELTGGEPEVT